MFTLTDSWMPHRDSLQRLYYFSGDEDVTKYFSLDSKTGIISVATTLDREQQDILSSSGVLDFSILVRHC